MQENLIVLTSHSMKTIKQVAKYFGNQKALAETLGVTSQAVSLWGQIGVPLARAYQIQVLSRGKFKVAELPLAPPRRHRKRAGAKK